MSVKRSTVRVVALAVVLLLATAGQPASARPSPIGTAKQRAQRLRVRLSQLQARSARAVGRYEATQHALEMAVAEHMSAQAALDTAQVESVHAEDGAVDRVRAIYMSGGTMAMYASVLEATDPHDALARIANINAVIDADAEVTSDASTRLAGAESATARLRKAALARVRLEEQAAEEATAIQLLLSEQQRLVASADKRVKQLLAAEKRRIEEARARARAREAARLAAQGGSSSGDRTAPYRPAGGRYSCPVGLDNHFVDTWHAPRSGGRLHQGTDVFAPYGSPAYAVTYGVIDQWGNGGLGGITLWLRADNGDRYYYAHNSRNVARVGTRVRPGQVIAYVGNTGNARTTPPHVHFEAHPGGGAAANPYPFLAAICGKV